MDYTQYYYGVPFPAFIFIYVKNILIKYFNSSCKDQVLKSISANKKKKNQQRF